MNIVNDTAKKITLIAIFLTTIFNTINSQPAQNLKFHHLNVDNGLPQSSAYSIIKDKYGFMWFGTWGGAVRYDGYEVKLFRPSENDSTALPDYRISCIVIDSIGNIWIETEQRQFLFQYNYSLDNFKRYNKSNAPVEVLNQVELWHNNHFKVAKNDKYIWQSTDSGLLQKQIATGDTLLFQPMLNNRFALSDKMIKNVYLDDEENLWIGTEYGGVNFTNLYSKPFNTFTKKQANKGLTDNVVRAICKDSEGHIWVGSSNMGITVINTSGIEPTYRYIGKENLCNLQIRSLHCDKEGKVWIGTKNGLMCYDPGSDKFVLCSNSASNQFFAFAEDQNGRLWVGTMAGLALFDRANDKLKYFPPQKTTGGIYIRSILADKNNNLWVATEDNGVTKLTPEFKDDTIQFKVEHYVQQNQSNNGLSSNRTYSLTEDSNGMIWIASDQGLCYLNPQNDTITRIARESNLSKGIIMAVLYDHQNSVWASHKKGLSRINTTSFTIQNFNIQDGLQGNEFSQNACFFDSINGELFFGGVNGLNSFTSKDIKTNPYPPRVVFTGLNVMQKHILPGQPINNRVLLEKSLLCTNKLILYYQERSFSLEFVALHYGNSSENKYQFQLEGFDKHWVSTNATNRKASYNNLPPGEYIFKVKAANSDGVWNPTPKTMHIVILPPWWLTWWAIGFYLVLTTSIIWLIYNYLTSKINAKRAQEIHQAKLKFFTEVSHEFRTPLTLIIDPLEKLMTGKIAHQDADSIFKMMYRNAKQLLELINQLLDFRKLESGHLTLSLQKSDLIAFVKNSVAAFENQALAQNISLEFEAPLTSLQICFDKQKLNMVLNNLLSNSFKFTPENGSIHIKVYLSDKVEKAVCIQVIDTGTGIEKHELNRIFELFYQSGSPIKQTPGSGIGLALTHELVKLHKGHIEVKSQINKGTDFSITLPIMENDSTESIQSETIFNILPETNTPIVKKESKKTDNDLPIMLIIDDNSDIRNYITTHFKTEFKIIQAANGAEGYSQAIETIPDIIISDVMMPDTDGFELCQKLKTDQHTSHIPIILLTARQSDESKTEGYKTGADAYITKPFNSDVLSARVNNLLEQRRQLRELFTGSTGKELKKVAVNSADEIFLEKASGIIAQYLDDPQFNIDFLAEKMNMSRSQFYRKIKALTNKSGNDFIMSFRMDKALEYLKEGRYNITETAYKVGYNVPANFTRAFTKYFGKTPTNYIESIKQ
ncbi:hybrid sensor histidine kinase/response regulator transcription factor [Plebeiibacterium marinum]|uniref:histidine kinase n=1 Tax=Plebeiibacterium marinum TaxID=2992111 RepID=A0AAE3SLW3_9BACT|nr:hybrid sensor histidine kinase/response regulator transcription factor [Plebeiobacterium marinum]MCW3808028.1 ATP-binding protein [Plebeiobacterium marinum]